MICRLCDRSQSFPYDIADTVVAESKHFVATPSLGAIVEGWILITSKEHILSFGAMHPSLENEFLEFKSKLSHVLYQEYGRVVAFEHGPALPNSKVGCTVDH